MLRYRKPIAAALKIAIIFFEVAALFIISSDTAYRARPERNLSPEILWTTGQAAQAQSITQHIRPAFAQSHMP
jgi:hypothetical protein